MPPCYGVPRPVLPWEFRRAQRGRDAIERGMPRHAARHLGVLCVSVVNLLPFLRIATWRAMR